MTTTDLISILPLIILVGWASIILLLDAFVGKRVKGLTASLAALGLLVVLVISFLDLGGSPGAFNGMIIQDGFSKYLQILFAGSGLIAVALAYPYLERMGIKRGEFYPLLLFSISGMILMAQAADLIVGNISYWERLQEDLLSTESPSVLGPPGQPLWPALLLP